MSTYKSHGLCSNKTYNFFGDVDLLIASEGATIDEAIDAVKEIYDKYEWNGWKRPESRKYPPMYKDIFTNIDS